MATRAKTKLFLALPAALFAAFCVAMALQISRSGNDALPSELIGKPAPSLGTSAFADFLLPNDETLKKPELKLVNFWASWCAPCRAEHPSLARMAESGIPIIGVNFKDREANGLRFLDELGNPYLGIAADPDGRVAINWGVYGIPETFIVDENGIVRLRHPGPITSSVIDGILLPEMQRLNQLKFEEVR